MHFLRPTETDGLADNRYKHEIKPTLSCKHQLLLMRLRPILDLDAALIRQLMYSNFDHSTDQSGARLFVPPSSSSLTTPSRPSWRGREVPDDPDLWSPASTIEILAPPITDDSLFPWPSDEPLVYASLWSTRVPFTFQAQPEDPSTTLKDSRGSTSTERPRAHSTVSQQAVLQIPALSETMVTTHGPSVLVPRRASSSSIDSQYPQRSTRSRHLSVANSSLSPSTKNRLEQSGSQVTLNISSGKTTPEPDYGAASTTDRIMAACAPDIADLWKDSTIRKILDDFFGIRVESEAGL